jgi:hypothetical protein
VKSLHRYAVYGLVVASEQPFGSLEPAGGADGLTITIRFAGAGGIPVASPAGRPETGPDEPIVHVMLDDGSVYLRVEDFFEVVVSPDGCDVICAASSSVDRRTFEANLMNFVLGTALTLRGEEPLHSTVIDLDGRAIGLLGQSGAGKSTLAALLVNRGADLVTDDMLRIEFAHGLPLAHQGPYRLKLLDESGRRFLPDALADGHFNSISGKIMVRPRETGRLRSGPLPLVGLYYIGELPGQPRPAAVSSVRLSGLELAKVILSSSMDDRYIVPHRLARQMAFAAQLSRALPVYSLRYPRSFDVMDEVAAEIHRTMGP